LKLWLDAQLSPQLAHWISSHFELEVTPVRERALRDATDEEIFFAARQAGAVVMTKDRDFALLLARHGPPPQVLWVTCGNTSNKRMRQILGELLAEALELLSVGEPLVEIGDLPRAIPRD
jgi:predicted nuclease of predicted toxin-antitoxin system